MVAKVEKTIKRLCAPAFIYFIISIIALIILGFQNYGNQNTYVCGLYQCNVSNTTGIFIGKLIYILFWTWILNVLCKAGYVKLSWFLLFLPFILMFVMIGALLIAQGGNINM